MNKRNKTYWLICSIMVIILMLLTFTPLVIPEGKYKPMFLGLPYTLWVSGLITVVLVILTWIGAGVHPGKDEGEDEA